MIATYSLGIYTVHKYGKLIALLLIEPLNISRIIIFNQTVSSRNLAVFLIGGTITIVIIILFSKTPLRKFIK